MASNRGVVYMGPGKVEVQPIDFPKMQAPDGRAIHHGVILKVVATNICGSDQHMVRGRTTAPVGLVLGHEITGEVIEKGEDVETVTVGDLVSVPFNVACGRCRNCLAGRRSPQATRRPRSSCCSPRTASCTCSASTMPSPRRRRRCSACSAGSC